MSSLLVMIVETVTVVSPVVGFTVVRVSSVFTCAALAEARRRRARINAKDFIVLLI
jgi:hypothetical protein